MELNEIKKALYRHNTKATLVKITKDGIVYEMKMNGLSEDLARMYGHIQVTIPLSEIENGKFYPEEDGKFLIRWIKLEGDERT